MTSKLSLLLILGLAQLACSQRLFRCFFYFDKEFVSYNLKDLYLEGDTKYLPYAFKHDGKDGQIYVNICDGVSFPEKCGEQKGNSSENSNQQKRGP